MYSLILTRLSDVDPALADDRWQEVRRSLADFPAATMLNEQEARALASLAGAGAPPAPIAL
jgi:hypothetical protein